MSPTPPGYTDDDLARRVSEPAKTAALPGHEPRPDSGRTPFARDRARVLHSGSLRRLAGKTQVVASDEDDVPRTRLTHSLEVAQIARGIGSQLGCDPDVVDLAGLAHDIGHPPFGHNGEDALNRIGAPVGGFEANAQNLRLLARLEPKILTESGESAGLNLCRASLDAVIKYPWSQPDERGKFGCYPEDRDVLDWVRGEQGTALCLEAQVMDWADDVAYSVHDVEDGILAGRIDLARLQSPEERLAVAVAARRGYSGESAADLAEVLGELLQRPEIVPAVGYRPGVRGAVALKSTTSELTGRLVTGAVAATRQEYGDAPLTRYAADLVVSPQLRAEVAMLKAIAVHYVMDDPERRTLQHRQQAVLQELVAALADRGSAAMDAQHGPRYDAAADDAGRMRAVLDQVASLTDSQAYRWHARLTGAVRAAT